MIGILVEAFFSELEWNNKESLLFGENSKDLKPMYIG
jgi:hypothetical protein